MKLKVRLLFQLISSMFLIIFLFISPIFAFTGDSFSQKVGDGFIWEVKVANYPLVNPEISYVNDRLKVEITIAEYGRQDCCGPFGDYLYGNLYNNSLEDRNWALFETDYYLAVYNRSTGFYAAMGRFFIPHNETVINSSMFNVFTTIWNYTSYNWISGANGYDGMAYGFNGSETGDFNESKKEYFYNKDGVLQHYKVYNGTGSSWNLIYHIELIDSYSSWDPIPLIISIAGIAIGLIGLYLFLDYRKNKKPLTKSTKIKRKRLTSLESRG